jgi:hypothetical protein
MKSKLIAVCCIVAGIAGLLYVCTGCEPKPSGKGILKLNLTDAPATYEEVFITFNQISVYYTSNIDNATDNDTDNLSMPIMLKKHDGDNKTDDNETNLDVDDSDNNTETDNGTDKEDWIIISKDEQGFDLLTLQGGKFDLLAQQEIEAGKYTQIRLMITDGMDVNGEPKTYVKVDGVKYPLEVPSGSSSGLKLNHPFTITADNETVLYLDFDAEKSVNQTGNGTYKLKPTIKVLTEPPIAQ